tara:strand:- start:101 stop:541 length:441 start_codon:yes stop_codon:yes gene_type:complete
LISILQRISSILIYTIPLKAVLPFGSILFYKFAFFKEIIFYVTLPIAIIENIIPYGSLLLFLILFAGVVRNPNVPYFVRFNGCQALLLNIALILFSYLLRIVPIAELGLFLFISSLAILIFCLIQCILGIEPEIPLISKSARMQIY